MTGLTLAIDAATYAGTVAVLRDGDLVAEAAASMRGEREERLMPAVVQALREAGGTPDRLERIVCGAGPGSFTSLRIAASIAKGLAFGAGATLHAVSSLWLIVAGARPQLPVGRYAAVLDAMRGDVFVAVFTVGDDHLMADSAPLILPRREVTAFARERGAHVIGPGEQVDAGPHARGAALLGKLVPWPAPADLATWQPDYGRLAEAQVKWEAAHGRALASP